MVFVLIRKFALLALLAFIESIGLAKSGTAAALLDYRPRIELVYSTDRSLCSELQKYLAAAGSKYPQTTILNRLILEDPFSRRLRTIMPKALSLPTQIKGSLLEDLPDATPHHALYSVALDPEIGEQLIAIHDYNLGMHGTFISEIYIFKPGSSSDVAFENDLPPPEMVTNSINASKEYVGISSVYFFEKIYSETDRTKTVEWRIQNNLSVSQIAARLFVFENRYYILAVGPVFFGPKVVFKIMPSGKFEDVCYYSGGK